MKIVFYFFGEPGTLPSNSDSYCGTLIGTRICSIEWCYFSVTLSDS